MFKLSIGPYLIQTGQGKLPELYPEYARRAILSDEFDLQNAERTHCFVSVARASVWPQLVVAQTFSPSAGGFEPGVLLVQETETLFIGAGERPLAYRLGPFERLWEDTCDMGFWGWEQHGEVVLMRAELELAAWDCFGKKLWSTFVEPPWDCVVKDDRIQLDVMGDKSEFDLAKGPKHPLPWLDASTLLANFIRSFFRSWRQTGNSQKNAVTSCWASVIDPPSVIAQFAAPQPSPRSRLSPT